MVMQTLWGRAVLIVTLLSASGHYCPKRRMHRAALGGAAVSARALADMIHGLSAWRDTHYSQESWRKLIQVARVVQACPPETVDDALDLFMTDPADEPFLAQWPGATKPFLLLRAVFDLPEDAPVEQTFSFGGPFGTTRAGDGTTTNLAWPISWKSGRPRIMTDLGGGSDTGYLARREFRYMLQHFRFRDLRAR